MRKLILCHSWKRLDFQYKVGWLYIHIQTLTYERALAKELRGKRPSAQEGLKEDLLRSQPEKIHVKFRFKRLTVKLEPNTHNENGKL